jgi:type I restriction enzyme R subunit
MSSASNLSFLAQEWPTLFEAAARAEALAIGDPRGACFYARRALELAVRWLYEHDDSLKLPYDDNLSALLHEPNFRNGIGPARFAKARLIKDIGNQAAHSNKPIRQYDALNAVRELFHLTFWLARTYARGVRPADGLAFDQSLLPPAVATAQQSPAQLRALEAKLREQDVRLSSLLADKLALNDELQRLRAEVAEAKQKNEAVPDAHDYSEAQTRAYLIDLLLREAGWPLDRPQDTEYEVSGMPNAEGKGYVDYVLWGDDGRPLAVVEAKRTTKDPAIGKQQAKLYADCLHQQFGRRPVVFYTNGYEHWIWDDLIYPPRSVQGFLKKDELELLILRRETRQPLADAAINDKIVERYYQTRAIRRIGESFERDNVRKALVVMATGAGKTRTVIALSDLLMRCNWAKRVLFLADRVALVNQAVNAFKTHLPEASPVNLVTEKEKLGRVYVSTYPTMMGLIEERDGAERRFGVGHFDLIVIDEAHRSVYQKYHAIFEYFDSLLVGLTATPKDEVDKNTYGLFDLETGVPTDVYSLEDAVKDGFLVPPRAVSVPLKFQREGIAYDQLSEEEKDDWDAIEWDEEDGTPDRVGAEAVNRWLFNKDTVEKVLEHLMTRGQTVAGGDRLGKTIIFAKNHAHAEFISQRFDLNYPEHKGHFARVIDFKVTYAQSLIDDFSNTEKAPHIAISVDMLDTGIDVPEVVNLVFFKLVRSKTKFWQMLGRGTRLRPDLFGPGQHKAFFYVFDYCGNLEFFSQDLPTTGGSATEPLGTRIFKARLELIGALDGAVSGDSSKVGLTMALYGADGEAKAVREATAALLRDEVAAMNVDNFIVRPRRQVVEKYLSAVRWTTLTPAERDELAAQLAGLPTTLESDGEEAKRFDLLLLNLQLGLLNSEPSFVRLRDQVRQIAGLLQDKGSIPQVKLAMPLILDLQTDPWWEDVTVPMLERVRRDIRLLVRFIEKRHRQPIYTDFTDSMGAETEIVLPGTQSPESYEKFRAKARLFLKEHEDHVAIQKLRRNKALTATDLQELGRMFVEAGVGSAADVTRAAVESQGLGLFVRSLVGLDRQAAKEALASFLDGATHRANQIEFVNEVVDYLTEHGAMPVRRLYESPYTDFHPLGVDGVFSEAERDQLIAALREIRAKATG